MWRESTMDSDACGRWRRGVGQELLMETVMADGCYQVIFLLLLSVTIVVIARRQGSIRFHVIGKLWYV
jgi:hypothetical protein